MENWKNKIVTKICWKPSFCGHTKWSRCGPKTRTIICTCLMYCSLPNEGNCVLHITKGAFNVEGKDACTFVPSKTTHESFYSATLFCVHWTFNLTIMISPFWQINSGHLPSCLAHKKTRHFFRLWGSQFWSWQKKAWPSHLHSLLTGKKADIFRSFAFFFSSSAWTIGVSPNWNTAVVSGGQRTKKKNLSQKRCFQ